MYLITLVILGEKMKKVTTLYLPCLLIILLLLFLSACSKPVTLSVSLETLIVTVGDAAIPINATLRNSKQEVLWTLSGNGTLSKDKGLVTSYTPPTEGEASTATILAKAGSREKTIAITIMAKPPEAILDDLDPELAFSAEVSKSTTTTLSFKNSGNKVLSFNTSSSADWLVVNPPKGDVAIAALQELEIAGNCGTDIEERTATLTIDSNSGKFDVVISLDCTRPGAILDDLVTNLTLSTEVSKSTNTMLSFKNSGDKKVLSYTATSNSAWLSITPTRGNVTIGATQNLNVSATCGAAIEKRTGSLTIDSNGGKSDVAVSLNCTRPGAILDALATNLTLSTEASKTTSKTISFKNSGDEKILNFTAKSENTWLSVTPAKGNVAIGATQDLNITATCSTAIEKRVGSIAIDSNGGKGTVVVSVNCTSSNTWNLPVAMNNVSYLNKLGPNKAENFSFFYAGHAYGTPSNVNSSTTDYPAKGLLNNIAKLKQHDFAVFGGDMIYSCLPASLVALENTLLKQLAMPIFNSSGNHDTCLSSSANYDYDRNISIQYGHNLFLIISSPKKRTSEVADVTWLIDEITNSKTNPKIRNVFVFTHIPIFLGLEPELKQAAELANNPLLEKASVINSLTQSMTDFKNMNKKLYWLSGDIGAQYPLIYHQYADNIYFLASGMFDNKYDHVLSIKVNDSAHPDDVRISIIGVSSHKFSALETYTHEWLARFK